MDDYNNEQKKFSAESAMNKSMSKSMYSFPKGARFDALKS